MQPRLDAGRTLRLILVPMIATFAATRLYLHGVGVTHVYPFGYLFHHLFTGVLLVIPAAFALAFGILSGRYPWLPLVALGVGSGLILDEMSFLIATGASDSDYVSPISLCGGVVCIATATVLLIVFHGIAQGSRRPGER